MSAVCDLFESAVEFDEALLGSFEAVSSGEVTKSQNGKEEFTKM